MVPWAHPSPDLLLLLKVVCHVLNPGFPTGENFTVHRFQGRIIGIRDWHTKIVGLLDVLADLAELILIIVYIAGLK